MQLALFDLDGTLLGGDSDTLWVRFLIDQQWLDGAQATRCAQVGLLYAAGTVVPEEYGRFQAGLLAGRTAADLLPLRQRFLTQVIQPRIPQAARDLLARHRHAGDTLVLTTATNRVVSELTALDLGVDAYLCTELECVGGRYSGRMTGPTNMRTGKVDRLRQWLAEQGQPGLVLKRACFYSDSINDLALLSVVGRPVVVDPDRRLAATALRKGWTQLQLHRQQALLPTETEAVA
jgi:HAD superfamily hydrolase (TIGR01490 family)